MRQKLKVFLLLFIFSLSLFSQTALAATYTVNSPAEEMIRFNRAIASGEREFTLDYNTDNGDYAFKNLCSLQYALQDYVDSDYAYYIMDSVGCKSKQSYVNGKNMLTVDYTIKGLETPKQTDYVYATIHKLIKDNPSIIKASDYDKAAWVYDYVTSHVTYDYGYEKYSAYYALHDGKAVCQGYSLLYYAFATELGLKCKIVSGLADNGKIGEHAWNVILLNGEWYCVDTTWGSSTGDRKYFLILKKDLTTHTFDPIYEDYFNYATTPYSEEKAAEYHGVPASVYGAEFDALKIIELTKGDSFQWLLGNPDKTALTFTSENDDVATISQKGIIKAVSSGQITIKAMNEELGIEQQCKVVVKNPEPKVTGFNNIKVIYNKKAAISLKVTPAKAKLDNVVYSSQDDSIATVDKNGVVTGKRVGATDIIVTYGDNNKVKIPVRVTPAYNNKYASITVSVGKTTSIKNAVTISNKGYKDLIFYSNYSKIASVSVNGTVTGVARGVCYLGIYDGTSGYLLAKIKVTVK